MGLLSKISNWLGSNTNAKESASVNNQEQDLLSRYQVLVENLAAALMIRDSTGKISYCSPYTEVLTGYSLPEIYDHEEDFLLSITHQDDKNELSRSFKLAQIGESFQLRFRFFHRSGIEMCAESRTSPLYDNEGSFIASLSILFDVTHAVKQEELLIERSEDLQSISSLVAEDIQNEVFTIKGMLQIGEQELPKEVICSSIMSAATKLEELADGLTEFGRTSRAFLDLRPLALNPLLVRFVEDQAKSGLKIINDIPLDQDEQIKVLAHTDEITEILNAILKYIRSFDEDYQDITLKINENPLDIKLELSAFFPVALSEATIYALHIDRKSIAQPELLRASRRIPFNLSLARRKAEKLGGALTYEIKNKDENFGIFTLRLKKARG